jgi:hypothetical protein
VYKQKTSCDRILLIQSWQENLIPEGDVL